MLLKKKEGKKRYKQKARAHPDWSLRLHIEAKQSGIQFQTSISTRRCWWTGAFIGEREVTPDQGGRRRCFNVQESCRLARLLPCFFDLFTSNLAALSLISDLYIRDIWVDFPPNFFFPTISQVGFKAFGTNFPTFFQVTPGGAFEGPLPPCSNLLPDCWSHAVINIDKA